MTSKTDIITGKRNGKSFFTLLEVLISMGVFAILMLALMQFFVSAQAVVERTSERTAFYDDARIAMNLLANDLACTFYEPEYDSSQYTFMYYDGSTSEGKTKITFATMRSDGLAEVYYFWDKTNMQLKLATLKETANFSDATWVTRPNSTWKTTVQAATPVVIAENVTSFEIILKDNATPANPITELPSSISPNYIKLPRLVEVTMKVISKETLEKLKAMSADFSSLTEPQQEIFNAGTQEFKRIVLIDRGQY
ncbi:MAG: hypothetical protein BWY31_01890 [Lentisphaerae bacterium ADurb.Bin242]|nr:MAG: hypothetical protein BWY31_01890 [Lentisphaerae bacterium ADurb.Bin242]